MALFRRKRTGGGTVRKSTGDDVRHLQEFTASRRGVEAYVEPRTTFTETTVVLVAADGEWTRRRIAGPEVARDLGKKLGIPVYDTNLVGYPKRMREWTARRKAAGQTGVPRSGGPVSDDELPPLQ